MFTIIHLLHNSWFNNIIQKQKRILEFIVNTSIMSDLKIKEADRAYLIVKRI